MCTELYCRFVRSTWPKVTDQCGKIYQTTVSASDLFTTFGPTDAFCSLRTLSSQSNERPLIIIIGDGVKKQSFLTEFFAPILFFNSPQSLYIC
ncbi:hypothetical protein FGIG_06067 [Fasciola gigantica]|uniref:Uncharacterized protein n=1 Tax=Fasciola gigantica TaxID=46835 RepID=A0A504YJ22_FASGI|nr:hypothetical protein FGIG_06067 [Fasciola gigantica]